MVFLMYKIHKRLFVFSCTSKIRSIQETFVSFVALFHFSFRSSCILPAHDLYSGVNACFCFYFSMVVLHKLLWNSSLSVARSAFSATCTLLSSDGVWFQVIRRQQLRLPVLPEEYIVTISYVRRSCMSVLVCVFLNLLLSNPVLIHDGMKNKSEFGNSFRLSRKRW